jgi:serine acetyltransferase
VQVYKARFIVRNSWKDYVSAGVFITLILSASATIVWLLRPISAAILASYHVVFDVALAFLSYGALSALLVTAMLRVKPFPAGEYPMDSPEFAYWKLLTVLYRLGQGALRWFFPFFLRPILDGLFGANIGKDAAFGGTIDDPYRVKVGNGVVLGNASLVSGNYVSGGKLVCGPVDIGDGVTIGANSVILPNSRIGSGAVIMSGSYLMPGTTVPAGETWRGNPARKWA